MSVNRDVSAGSFNNLRGSSRDVELRVTQKHAHCDLKLLYRLNQYLSSLGDINYIYSSSSFERRLPPCDLFPRVSLCAGGAEAHRHGAVLGEQSRRPDGAAVSAQSPVRDPSSGTVW